MAMTKIEPCAYLIDYDEMSKLRDIQELLHGGTDRERDCGHRLWLVLNRAIPIATAAALDELAESSRELGYDR
jgi:hypothetical protein